MSRYKVLSIFFCTKIFADVLYVFRFVEIIPTYIQIWFNRKISHTCGFFFFSLLVCYAIMLLHISIFLENNHNFILCPVSLSFALRLELFQCCRSDDKLHCTSAIPNVKLIFPASHRASLAWKARTGQSFICRLYGMSHRGNIRSCSQRSSEQAAVKSDGG